MTISPVSFNGMLQNTQELSVTKLHEDHMPIAQQQETEEERKNEVEHMLSSVHEQDDTASESDVDADGKGGAFYQHNKSSKKKKKKVSDGSVRLKSEIRSFDMKI